MRSAGPIHKPPAPSYHSQDAAIKRLSSTSLTPTQSLRPVLPLQRTIGGLGGSGAPRPLLIQRKLEVGAVDDPRERAADRMADQAMRGPDAKFSLASSPPTAATISHTAAETSVSASVHEVLKTPGQPLDPADRAYFEPRFGHAFGHVRIHADQAAAQSAARLGARAWTSDSQIAFGGGTYAPATQADAH